MVESVGKKLGQARQRRGLTLEEVAHVTKLRPDKIVALENDDYSSFPSNAYAKGFLQIYARYLHVDVSEFLSSLDSTNSISVDDYQYLSNAPAPKPVEPERRDERRRPPSVAPLVFFIFVVLIGLGVMWLFSNYQRTLPLSARAADAEEKADGGSKPQESSPAPANAVAANTNSGSPAVSSGSAPSGSGANSSAQPGLFSCRPGDRRRAGSAGWQAPAANVAAPKASKSRREIPSFFSA